MGTHRFYRYELRTTDVSAAQAFYAELLGPTCWDAELSVSPLPERARSLGAPAHWLGHLAVADPTASAARFIALGAQQLGPTLVRADGSSIVLRDPFGAGLALSCEAPTQPGDQVAWHGLDTHDRERAFTVYSELFGWSRRDLSDLGPQIGQCQNFAWGDAGPALGSMSTIAASRPVHPQWIFYFRVTDIEASLARVQTLGGKLMGSLRTPNGDTFAACDDAQDAGFGLYQLRAR